MDINQFGLRQSSFEIRYPKAFLLWDRSGSVWADAFTRWPELKLITAQPNVMTFKLGSDIELAILLDRAHVISATTKHDPDLFGKLCAFIIDSAIEVGVEKYSRVGYRLTFVKRYQTIDEATDAFASIDLVKFPKGKNFGIDGRIKNPDCSFRLEDENLGCRCQLAVQTKSTNIELPLGESEEVKFEASERHDLIFDCDYYTTADVAVGQLKTDVWLRQAEQVMRRDAKVILGG